MYSVTIGELPPPPPRACFGRDELIEIVIDLAQDLTPIALVGAGGIGKTCIALAVLHHDYIKQRFGDNRRFIRCDQFSASCTNFLRRLSKVIGADVDDAEDLTPLRPTLASKEMFVVLDNAESILDPRGTDGEKIYGIVEELSQLDNICLCITSRITTIPPHCETLEIPTLSMEAACATFYRINKYDRQTDSVNDILDQLDFHPLSVTLLATVAQQNRWDNNRLAGEWEQRQTAVLETGHNKSLASAVELSLSSPMFKGLGPKARGLLEVVAFFPQGVDENNLDWLFPTISNRTNIFDTFCILSLTYRNHGFITMLAPLRDYLCPKNPMLSPPLCAAKDHYFSRMSVKFSRNTPVFEESQWITSEDINVEHLLDVFTTVDANSESVWNACEHFIRHLYWHKPRHTVLKQKIEGLPDEHRSKPQCLFVLAELCSSFGNPVDRKRFLTHTLGLRRAEGDDHHIALTLRKLSNANRMLGLYKEGIQHLKEATGIFERLGETGERTKCLNNLAHLLYKDEQLDAAEDVATYTIRLLPEKGEELLACKSHRLLGNIYHSKGDKERAIHHFETALRITSPFSWHDQLFWIHYSLAELFSDEDEFDTTQAHIKLAKSHAVENSYNLGRAMELQAGVWYRKRRLEEAMSEALHALVTYEKFRAAKDLERCRNLLRDIERATKGSPPSG